MPAIFVLLDLRGHGAEIFDESYLCFLQHAFSYYGEGNCFLHTDVTPFLALKDRVQAPEPIPSYRALVEAHIAARPPLAPRARMPKADTDVWKTLRAMWLRDSFDAEACLGPLLRTFFSPRCQGGYVPSAAALRASLRAFLLDTVAPSAPAGAAVHVYWASHGNYLMTPALSSRRGVYGIVALRSQEETEGLEDTSLTAQFLAQELMAPLARALAPSGGALLWVHHSCYSAPILAAAAQSLRALDAACAPLLPGLRLCLVADKPCCTPFKQAYLAPYNDNAAFVLPWTEGSRAGLCQAVAGLLANLRAAETRLAAVRVRWELERDLKARACAAAPVAPWGPHDAPRAPLTVPQLRLLWPVAATAEGPKKDFCEWEHGLLESSGEHSDARFAPAYGAAEARGMEALEGALEEGAAAVPLNLAVARAFRAAAGVLQAELGLPCLAPAAAALAVGARSGFPEAAAEHFCLCRGAEAAAEAAATPPSGTASSGGSSSSSAGGRGSPAPTGGAAAWEAVAAFCGEDRPAFYSYLAGVARGSAELSAAQAQGRLEAVAAALEAWAGEGDVSALVDKLRGFFMGAAINNVGDQSSGGHFVSRVFLDWLRGGGGEPRTLARLEEHMYSTWARWGVGADVEGLYHEASLARLTAFPEDFKGKSGIVHCWGLGEDFDLSA